MNGEWFADSDVDDSVLLVTFPCNKSVTNISKRSLNLKLVNNTFQHYSPTSQIKWKFYNLKKIL